MYLVGQTLPVTPECEVSPIGFDVIVIDLIFMLGMANFHVAQGMLDY